jgi:hypothetical protein
LIYIKVYGKSIIPSRYYPEDGSSGLHIKYSPVLNELTPWSRVLLEKLTGLQLVKKFPTFYGTRKFITVFASARHLSLS